VQVALLMAVVQETDCFQAAVAVEITGRAAMEAGNPLYALMIRL
jgi:hypothetical protein